MFTIASCRALACDDEARAMASDLPNLRERFEASAAAWNERADLLERLGRSTHREPSHAWG